MRIRELFANMRHETKVRTIVTRVVRRGVQCGKLFALSSAVLKEKPRDSRSGIWIYMQRSGGLVVLRYISFKYSEYFLPDMLRFKVPSLYSPTLIQRYFPGETCLKCIMLYRAGPSPLASKRNQSPLNPATKENFNKIFTPLLFATNGIPLF